MSERLLLNPEIIELSSANSIFMTLKMIICTSNVNLNGTKFTEDFIDGICNNEQDFQGIALVVNRSKLENEQYTNLSHEFNGETLGTDMIGSFVGFEKAENSDGSYSLVGEARIMKRFPKTCNAIAELYDKNELRFSCEALVREYSNASDGYREVDYKSGQNSLIANCIVSTPAEVQAKPTLLVASLDEDLMNQVGDLESGGVNGVDISNAEKRELMNAFVTKLGNTMMAKAMVQDILENSETDLAPIPDEVVSAMMNLVDDFSENSYVSFWVSEEMVYDNYFITYDYYSGDYFKFDYSISDDDNFTASNPREVELQFIESAEKVLSSISKELKNVFAELQVKKSELSSLQSSKEDLEKQLEEKNAELSNLNAELSTMKTEFSTMKTEKEQVENELSTAKEEVELKDKAISTTELEANEKIIQLGEVVESLKEQLKAVEPVIEEYNKVQQELAEKAKAEKQQELIKYAINSKMIDEKEISEVEEIKIAIAELDEVKIKSIVADRIVKQNVEMSKAKSEIKPSDDVVISVSDTKDYIEPSLEEKYGL